MKFVVILFALFVISLPTGKALANPVSYRPSIEDKLAELKKAGLKVCPECEGWGRLWSRGGARCTKCKGRGGLRVCWRCNGCGRIWRWWLWRTVCPTCKGSGRWDGWLSGRSFN